MSFATITICGNVGQAPQLRNVGQNNTTVLEFSVAVNYKENNQEQTEWYRISVWGKKAQSLQGLIRPGTLLCASGLLKVKMYTDKNNQPGISRDINADDVHLLANFGNQDVQPGTGQNGNMPAANNGYQSAYGQAPQQQAYAPQQQPQQGYGQPQQGYPQQAQQGYQQQAPNAYPAPPTSAPQQQQQAYQPQQQPMQAPAPQQGVYPPPYGNTVAPMQPLPNAPAF